MYIPYLRKYGRTKKNLILLFMTESRNSNTNLFFCFMKLKFMKFMKLNYKLKFHEKGTMNLCFVQHSSCKLYKYLKKNIKLSKLNKRETNAEC